MSHSQKTIKVVGVSGSLRAMSLNTKALYAARDLAPVGMDITIGDISHFPLYNEDEKVNGFPKAVATLCRQIADADAVLFVSPEYNFSISGVLKNAIDWASRWENPIFQGKAVGIISASPGMLGGARSQYHLRQVCVFLDAYPVNRPEVFIGQAHTKFDEDGKLSDPDTRTAIAAHLEALKSLALSRKIASS